MKKFIAALFVVAMVFSMCSMAFAASVNCYDMTTGDHENTRTKLTVDGVKAGDTISFYVKFTSEDTAGEGLSMYCRADGTCATYADGEEVYSGQHISKYGVPCNDGWFYIECTATADGTHDIHVDGADKIVVSAAQIAGLKINGVEVAASAVGASTGSSTIEEPVKSAEAPAASDDGDDEGGDTTATTGTTTPARTGVVSAAVVAAAAVLGGAVVLKKKEF